MDQQSQHEIKVSYHAVFGRLSTEAAEEGLHAAKLPFRAIC